MSDPFLLSGRISPAYIQPPGADSRNLTRTFKYTHILIVLCALY